MPTPNPRLAVESGTPVRTRPWPAWPRADAGTEAIIREVLHSGRWAISGQHNGSELYERRFARAFAEFNGVPFCVPVANGSAALIVALRAVGVGYGDEVVVPGLTWVSCAASVLALGAVPVFVDVEPETLALSAEATRAAVTPRTAAILVVHPYCTLADLDAFVALSAELDVPLIEDCSQAHGAAWRGRRVGGYGAVGIFSMQESKTLTCGEGGAAVTNDERIYDLMAQLRADGRRYRRSALEVGRPELEEVGDVQGTNFCLSELQAAILLDRLQHLPAEMERREANAAYLGARLAELGGIAPLERPSAATAVGYWRFTARLDFEHFGGWGIDRVSSALTAELGIHVKPVDPPIVDSKLYTPLRSPLGKAPVELRRRLEQPTWDVPVARAAHASCIRIPHRMLLAERTDMDDVVAAFAKVQAAACDAGEGAVAIASEGRR
jgi:dTDP-4-amino-4,6-dideoxygalactose transaminase